jgi:predicted HTH domain antitoxin
MKTLTIGEVCRDGVTKAVRTAEQEPVLIRRGDKPAVWMVSARDVARIAVESGGDTSRAALEILAARLFGDAVLTMNQAAQLAGLTLNDFLTLCDRLHVPVVQEQAETESGEREPAMAGAQAGGTDA